MFSEFHSSLVSTGTGSGVGTGHENDALVARCAASVLLCGLCQLSLLCFGGPGE